MTQKNIPKKQHWVPKFYLKEFATPSSKGKKNPQVCVIDKSGNMQKPRAMSIRTLCSQQYLYTPIGEGGERDISLEQEFADMESDAADFWPDLAAGQYGISNPDQKLKVSEFLAAMQLRNKRIFDLHRSIMEKRDILFGGPISEDKDGSKRVVRPFEKDPDPTDPSRFFAGSMRRGISRLTSSFNSRHWIIFRVKRDCILTSDIPISFFNEQGRSSGPGKKGAKAIFPITPKSILYISEESGTNDDHLAIENEEIIGFFNGITYSQAERFVICNVETDK